MTIEEIKVKVFDTIREQEKLQIIFSNYEKEKQERVKALNELEEKKG